MAVPAEASIFQQNYLSHKEKGFSLALRCCQLDRKFKEQLSLIPAFRELENKIPIIETPEYHLGNSFVVPSPESIEIKSQSANYMIIVSGNSITISHLEDQKIVILTLLRAEKESNQIYYQERRNGQIVLDSNTKTALARGEELFNSFVENINKQISQEAPWLDFSFVRQL